MILSKRILRDIIGGKNSGEAERKIGEPAGREFRDETFWTLSANQEESRDTEEHSLSDIQSTVLVALFMLFAGAIFLFVFSRFSLRLDEAQSLWQTSHSIPKILEIVGKDVHVPLYHLILHAWQLFLGNDVAVARLLSLLFFLAAIPALFYLGRISYGNSVGIFTALLFAISPFMNWYASEIRMYTLFAFLTILNQCCFVRIFKGSLRAWYGYAATAVLGSVTHYFFAFSLAAQGIFFLARQKEFPQKSFLKFIAVACLAALFVGGWMAYVISLGEAGNSQPLLLKPTTVDLFNTFSQFLFGFQESALNTLLVSMWPVAVLFGFFTLQKNRRVDPLTFYFLLSALFPIAAAFAVSITVRPLYVSRYLILAVPSLYIVIAWFLSNYPSKMSFTAKNILIGAMLFTLYVEASGSAVPVQEDYLSAAGYLTRYAEPQDIIAVSAPFTIYPVEYYYKGSADLTTLPAWDRNARGPIPAFSQDQIGEDLDRLKGSHRRMWVLLSYDQGYQEDLRIYLDTHFERVSSVHFSKGMDLYLYKLRYD